MVRERTSIVDVCSAPFDTRGAFSAAGMQNDTSHLDATQADDDGLTALAEKAAPWVGEPFLHEGEDAAQALAEGTARRRALDQAIAQMETGARSPSSDWRVSFALMLGLERVLSQSTPQTASGTELRRHQTDALAGMLTELIALNEDPGDANGGDPTAAQGPRRTALERRCHRGRGRARGTPSRTTQNSKRRSMIPARGGASASDTQRVGQDDRGGRLCRVCALDGSADPYPPSVACEPVQPGPHNEGYGDRFTDAILPGAKSAREHPITVQTYAWFARHVDSLSRDAYQLVICDEAHTALGRRRAPRSAACRSRSSSA